LENGGEGCQRAAILAIAERASRSRSNALV
jgi:hypothetical protein